MISEDTANQSGSTKSRIIIRAVRILVGVVVLYLLSPGPMTAILYRIDREREWDDPWLQNLYRPISYVNEHSPAFQRCMARYLEFWLPPPRN
ncbi:hypothetical protein [Chthoniobacter sp.]|uniref:hypothetical protein n=1 Tax=Chthoniobacter sp. TaxID=2510640 RepID=UPI0032AEF3FE